MNDKLHIIATKTFQMKGETYTDARHLVRMAGNIAAGLVTTSHGAESHEWVIQRSVAIARRIAAEVERTENIAEQAK